MISVILRLNYLYSGYFVFVHIDEENKNMPALHSFSVRLLLWQQSFVFILLLFALCHELYSLLFLYVYSEMAKDI